MTDYFHTTMNSPLGEIVITGDGDNISGVYLTGHADFSKAKENSRFRPEIFQTACQQLQEYFTGQRVNFNLPLQQPGTEFQQTVWQALLQIPSGQTKTYGDICKAIGKEKAYQAVGSANGSNKIAIIVPCHRVIGKDGKLTGYAGGLAAKQWLIDHESRTSH